MPLQVEIELSPATVTNLVVEDSDDHDHEDSDEDYADHDEADGDDNDHLSPVATHQHRSPKVIPGEEAEDLKSR